MSEIPPFLIRKTREQRLFPVTGTDYDIGFRAPDHWNPTEKPAEFMLRYNRHRDPHILFSMYFDLTALREGRLVPATESKDCPTMMSIDIKPQNNPEVLRNQTFHSFCVSYLLSNNNTAYAATVDTSVSYPWGVQGYELIPREQSELLTKLADEFHLPLIIDPVASAHHIIQTVASKTATNEFFNSFPFLPPVITTPRKC